MERGAGNMEHRAWSGKARYCKTRYYGGTVPSTFAGCFATTCHHFSMGFFGPTFSSVRARLNATTVEGCSA